MKRGTGRGTACEGGGGGSGFVDLLDGVLAGGQTGAPFRGGEAGGPAPAVTESVTALAVTTQLAPVCKPRTPGCTVVDPRVKQCLRDALPRQTVSKSVLHTLYSVQKCIIHSI